MSHTEPLKDLWCSDEELSEITDTTVFLALVLCYVLIVVVAVILITCFSKRKHLDSLKHLEDERMYYAEWMGRYPFINFLLMSVTMILLSGLAGFTKCGTLREFSIDKETENYIKSDSPVTQSFDALASAIVDNSANNNWPYRRTTYINRTNPLAMVEMDSTVVNRNEKLVFRSNNLDIVISEGRRNSNDRRLAKRDGITDKSVTFVYLQRERPSNVFTEKNLWQIYEFEQKIYQHPQYNSFCRSKSYYTGKVSDMNVCAKQASAITGWFFVQDDEEKPQLLDLDSTIRGMAQSGVAVFMDIFFSLDHMQSNLTRSTFYFEYPESVENDAAFKSFLIEELVTICKAEDLKEGDMRFLYYDSGTLFDWEVDTAVLNDSTFATFSFLTVLVFVWLHTRSIIVSVMGMLGVLASLPITMFIYTSVLNIEHMSILNFLSLFVIMGIGADDVFVFFDTYEVVANEHPDIEDDIPLRTALTYRRAGSAMLVTSVSTAASFFANWVSSLPVIREFGIFMGLVVVVNFIIVLTYFPSITICEDKWCSCFFRKRRKKKAGINKLRKNFKKGKSMNGSIVKKSSEGEDRERKGGSADVDNTFDEEAAPLNPVVSNSASIVPYNQLPTASLSPIENSNGTGDYKKDESKKDDSEKDDSKLPSKASPTNPTIADVPLGGGEGILVPPLPIGLPPSRPGPPRVMRKENTAGRLLGSMRDSFSASMSSFGVDYSREDNRLTAEDGWSWMDMFFHNTWAPFVYKMRHFIVVLVCILVILCAVSAFLFLLPADKPPSFFPESHNLGMLEIVNSDYVASSTIDIDSADAVAWGVMDSEGGSGTGGSGGGSDLTAFCPVLDGQACAGNGACNGMTGKCICYTDWSGTDCSQDISVSLVVGNIEASSTIIKGGGIIDYDDDDDIVEIALTNTGEVTLNYYLYYIDKFGGNTFFENDATSLPNWIELSSYSGTVRGGGSSKLTVTLKPTSACEESASCQEEFIFHLADSGVAAEALSFRTDISVSTASPSSPPSFMPSTSSPSLSPSGAPSSQPTQNPTSVPSSPPTMNPSGAPSETPTGVPSLPPSGEPTNAPSVIPTGIPSNAPSILPTGVPSDAPSTNIPSAKPSVSPSSSPSGEPTEAPSIAPSTQPTSMPSSSPSEEPTEAPSSSPSAAPSEVPSVSPTQPHCTNYLKDVDETDVDCGGSDCPACAENEFCSVWQDCKTQNCDGGTCGSAPSAFPSVSPSLAPSSAPSTHFPSISPTNVPSNMPSVGPTNMPSSKPSVGPTNVPSNEVRIANGGNGESRANIF